MENILLNNTEINNMTNNEESLLDYTKTYEPMYIDDGGESLLASMTKSGEELKKIQHNIPTSSKLSYEEQARIVFENYIRNTNRFLSGKEKRRLLRECIRNAKKGRYEYMFDEEKIAKKRERTAKAFEKMNSSNVSTKN